MVFSARTFSTHPPALRQVTLADHGLLKTFGSSTEEFGVGVGTDFHTGNKTTTNKIHNSHNSSFLYRVYDRGAQKQVGRILPTRTVSADAAAVSLPDPVGDRFSPHRVWCAAKDPRARRGRRNGLHPDAWYSKAQPERGPPLYSFRNEKPPRCRRIRQFDH